MWEAIASIGGNILSSLMNQGINKSNVNATNAYNSPVQQMLRFKQAGLNPNLVYSQGNPGNMTSATYQSPTPEVDFGKGISGAMQMLSTYADMKQKAAQTDATNAQAAATRQSMDETASRIDLNKQSLLNMIKDSSLKDIDIASNSFGLSSRKQLFPYQLTQAALDNLKTIATNQQIAAQTELTKYQREYSSPASVANTNADTATKWYMYKNLLPLDASSKAISNFGSSLGNIGNAIGNVVKGYDFGSYSKFGMPSNSPWYLRYGNFNVNPFGSNKPGGPRYMW